MASDIELSGLTATGGAGQIKLTWEVANDPHPRGLGLPYLAYAAGEVFAAISNDRSVAVKVGEGQTDFLHTGLSRGATNYYWVRARNANAVPDYGEFFPVSSTAGVLGTETNADFVSFQTMTATAYNISGGTFNSIATAEGGFWRTPNGLIFQWGRITQPANCFIFFEFPIVFPGTLFALIPGASALTTSLVSASVLDISTTIGAYLIGHAVANGGVVSNPQMDITFIAIGI